MSNWPRAIDVSQYEDVNLSTTTSLPGSVTSAASANAKGAWTQAIAATSFAYDGLVAVQRHSAAIRRCAVDIAIGASGSETIIVSDFITYVTSSAGTQKSFHLPVSVPADSRIAVRIACDAASGAVRLGFHGYRGGFNQPYSFSAGQQVGFTNTSGTTVDAGSVINTKGAWAAIGTVTTFQCKAFILCIQTNSFPTAAATVADYLVDIAVGSSFDIVIPNLHFGQNNAATGGNPTVSGPFHVSVPEGGQLYARCQCTTGTAGSRELQISYLAFY